MAAVSHSFHLAKDCGFKVVTHLMPDLPNTGYERDLLGYQEYFENVNLKQEFDLIITNVPFLENPHKDRNYKSCSLHNYFLQRSMDLVKPGGLVVALTSRYTMDTVLGEVVRKRMENDCSLIAAARLPVDVFSDKNADVVSDVLFIRKKIGLEERSHLDPSMICKIDGFFINLLFGGDVLSKGHTYGGCADGIEVPQVVCCILNGNGSRLSHRLIGFTRALVNDLSWHSDRCAWGGCTCACSGCPRCSCSAGSCMCIAHNS